MASTDPTNARLRDFDIPIIMPRIHVRELADFDDRVLTVELARPAFHSLVRPSISGTARVTHRLTAHHGHWSPAPTHISYQWLRSNEAIPGAHRATYRATPADRGHLLSVQVTVARSGYLDSTRISAAVRVRARD